MNKGINKNRIVLISLILIVAFTTFYKFCEIPKYINVDEAGTALNAYSLIVNGTDRHGVPWPIYPNNYYSGQSLLPTLLVYVSMRIFGNNIFAVRFPFALMRIVCIFPIYYSFENKKISLIALFLYAIWPFFIMSSRFTLDCNLIVYVLIFAILFLFKYLRNSKKRDLIISGLLFGLSYYCYALSYLTITIFIVLFFGYLLIEKKISIKEVIFFIIPVVVLGLPLLIRLHVDINYLNEFSIFGITFNRIKANRASDIGFSYFKITNLIDIIKSIFIEDRFDSLSYIFGGPCLYLPLILLVIFIIKTIKNKENRTINICLLLMFASSFLIGMLLDNIITWRFNVIYVPLLFISALTLNEIETKYQKIISIAMLTFFIIFSYCYLNIYEKEYTSVMFDNGLYESYNYAKTLNKDIYVKDSRLGEEYVYYFLFDEGGVAINDYPKDYYPETVYDSKRDITLYLSFDEADDNAIYMVFGELDENSSKYTNINKYGSWYVCHN